MELHPTTDPPLYIPASTACAAQANSYVLPNKSSCFLQSMVSLIPKVIFLLRSEEIAQMSGYPSLQRLKISSPEHETGNSEFRLHFSHRYLL